MSDGVKDGNVGSRAISDKVIEKPLVNAIASPFVTDDDLFMVSARFFKENKKFIVEGVDDGFDALKGCVQVLTLTVKYPSQGDASLINGQVRRMNDNIKSEDINVTDYMQIELIRLLTLVRKWDIKEDLNNENILKLSPKVIKVLLEKIRTEIGFDGII